MLGHRRTAPAAWGARSLDGQPNEEFLFVTVGRDGRDREPGVHDGVSLQAGCSRGRVRSRCLELDASAAGDDSCAHLVISAAQPGVVCGRPGQ